MVMEVVNDTAMVLGWTAPANTFGSLVAYIVTCGPEIPELLVITVNASSTGTSATVSGLENGARYNCSVRALNAALLSDSSVPITIHAQEIGECHA